MLLSRVAAPRRNARRPATTSLIVGGQVIDGSGAPGVAPTWRSRTAGSPRSARFRGATRREVIDATGLVVAPGFIDVHTHADDLAEHPRAENFVRMGVTTIVAGNCGGSALDVGEALRGSARPAPRSISRR